MRLAPEIHHLLIDLGLGRIGMDRPGDRLRSGAGFHRNRKLADHVAGMGRDDRGAENLVRALLNVDPREPFVFAVENRAIHFVELVRVGFDLHAFLLRILLVHPDMGDFRLGEGTPGHDQRFDAGIAQTEGMRE